MRPFLLSLVLAVAVQAQAPPATAPGRIVGVVVDGETGEPLVGAAVVLSRTALGAAADLDGRFRIEGVPPGAQVVRVSYVGYETAEVEVTVRSGTEVWVGPCLSPRPANPCVIGCAGPPGPVGAGVYQARVVDYLARGGSCCEPGWAWRGAPVVRWADR